MMREGLLGASRVVVVATRVATCRPLEEESHFAGFAWVVASEIAPSNDFLII
jgi:hypothetical protein